MAKRLSGVLCHPTSLPSPFGIGDLGKSAYKFIDFLYKGKQSLWQILPLGPTSFGDSPYQSFSSFAGNTLLISPDLLYDEGLLNDNDININTNDRKIDYGKVINFKESIYKKAYENFDKEDKDYKNFCKTNKTWLDDYVLFVSIKKHFIEQRKTSSEYTKKEYTIFKNKYKDKLLGNLVDDYFYGAVWTTWPEGLSKRQPKTLNQYEILLKDEIDYNKFLQYIFFKQWLDLKKYANKKNINIIGDIPIFVAFDSCDVWTNQKIFLLEKDGYPTCVAGVPPDYFSETGQLWGNPLYDWKENKKTDYEYWTSRIEGTLKNVDMLRIDHFRGFATYWEIAFGSENAIKGKWQKGPAHDFFNAIQKKLGTLPIIAEDLGDPHPLTDLLRNDFNLPGMKILQFAFEDESNNTYLPHNYENNNIVVYSGTHDNDTSLGWYEKASEKAKDYLRRYLNTPAEEIAWDFIRLCFSTSANYAIVPIQDIMNLGSDDRMNTPGVASNNWQFRYTSDMLKDAYAYRLAYLSELYNRNQNN